ncbi:MAG: ABC transporter permease subunit, partial [Bacillota bacterium]|nr:ABC transporter permease subunit [Bacillota bacterium]
VGLKHFRKLFASSNFLRVLSNTLIINGMKIVILFPIPIIVAILLNEIRRRNARKLLQTSIYIPYFFSWVVVFGIFYSLLGTYGIVNGLLSGLGIERVRFFTDQKIFRWLLVFTEGWKEVGYNAVIYLAAITGIDVGLYEAAKIDGANKWRLTWHITLPGILPTIVLMLILKVGYILDTGFEQVLVFYNAAVYDVADIIQTYVYRLSMGKMDFSMSTALGLFNSVVAFVLIIGANTVSKRLLNRSIW